MVECWTSDPETLGLVPPRSWPFFFLLQENLALLFGDLNFNFGVSNLLTRSGSARIFLLIERKNIGFCM